MNSHCHLQVSLELNLRADDHLSRSEFVPKTILPVFSGQHNSQCSLLIGYIIGIITNLSV